MGFLDKYPYTNWHNVNLDWVLERVKEWGQMVEANDQAFKDLEEANASFKTYVENYLQNLDIQAQIDDKLDRMLEDGTLTPYLQPYVSTAVTDWLEEHITEPEGIVIDSSLTVVGAAADSYETGKRIKDLFTNNAKSLLLNALRKIAWISNDGDMIYNNLQIALFNGDVFNKWHYALTEGSLIMTPGSIEPNQNNDDMYPSRAAITSGDRRRNFKINYGIVPYYIFNETAVASLFFPIPIPQAANRISINMTPVQFIFVGIMPYNDVRNWYDNTIQTLPWTQVNSAVNININRQDNRQLFMYVNTKYDSAGTTYPAEPSQLIIDFSI